MRSKNGTYYYGAFAGTLPKDMNCYYIFGDGAYYTGAINQGKFNGKGSLIKRIEEFIKFSYEGDWQEGYPHGRGIETIHNSMTYEGEF